MLSNRVDTNQALDDDSIVEIESLLSIPLSSLALKVPEPSQYSTYWCTSLGRTEAVAVNFSRRCRIVDTAYGRHHGREAFGMILPLLEDEPRLGAGDGQ